MSEPSVCKHIEDIKELTLPQDYICEECAKTHSLWVHLRTCQTCGETLCCDQSPNKHMTKHHHKTGHPVIISAEPGEKWMYCYNDDLFVDYE